MSGLKRSLDESSHDGDKPSPSDSSVSTVKPASPVAPSASSSSSSSFRNVSACNRCRLRKNRCDQRLPSCASCDKAGVKCVGYDPITKREIPRRYEVSRGAIASRLGLRLTNATAMSSTAKPESPTSSLYSETTRFPSKKPKTSIRPLRPMDPSHHDPYPPRHRLAMAIPNPPPLRPRRRATSTIARSLPSLCQTSAWSRCKAPVIRDI
jgi:hypothetical protein